MLPVENAAEEVEEERRQGRPLKWKRTGQKKVYKKDDVNMLGLGQEQVRIGCLSLLSPSPFFLVQQSSPFFS